MSPRPGDPCPGFHGRGRPVLADGLQTAAAGDALPRGTCMDRSLVLATR